MSEADLNAYRRKSPRFGEISTHGNENRASATGYSVRYSQMFRLLACAWPGPQLPSTALACPWL
jgi:hypothetical protein